MRRLVMPLCALLIVAAGCGAEEAPGWTERSATEGVSPLDGTKLVGVEVVVERDWTDERADEITGDLWVKYGAVRVEFYCNAQPELLARTMQTEVDDYKGTAFRMNECP